MRIKKAIIAVAGSGTRLLPATKSMPKEMLPLIDKPIIQILVEELVEAGIEDIILVTKWDKKPLEDHFDHSAALLNNLKKSGKKELFKKVDKISKMANFVYVRQIPKYGNGMPILSAASLVDNEPFVYCYGDDVVKAKTSFTKKMVEEFDKNGVPILGVQEVPENEVNRYGIAKLRKGTNEIEDVIEKPPVNKAPSRLALFGRMILNQGIINTLMKTKPGKDGEVWVTDAIKNYIEAGNICHVQKVLDGKWMTTGDPLNYLKAILAYAEDRPDLKEFLETYFSKINKD